MMRYHCAMCKFYLVRFLSYGVANPLFETKHVEGGGFRDQARCFVCGSLDRERLIYTYLKHHTFFKNAFYHPSLCA
jgi:hypothetical protein